MFSGTLCLSLISLFNAIAQDGESATDEYSTVELYFSDTDWTMQV